MMLLDEITKDPVCNNWEDACTLVIDKLFESIKDNLKMYSKDYNFIFGTIQLTKDPILNMNLILDLMIDKKIWIFDDKEYDYEIAKKIVQYWFGMSFYSVIASKNIDSSFDIDAYKDFVNKTVIKKQKDYGPKNISRFGLNGLVIRMHDKVGRLDNLIKNGLMPENESIIDNLLDVIGYSVVAIMWTNQTFLLPIKGN